jgi:hypothetical protein
MHVGFSEEDANRLGEVLGDRVQAT